MVRAVRSLGSVNDEVSLYERVGGRAFFDELVDHVYDHWLEAMREAVDALEPPADAGAALLGCFEMAADTRRNEA